MLPDEVEFGMILEETDYRDEYQPRVRNFGKVQHHKFTGYGRNDDMIIYGYREETVHGTSIDGRPHSLVVFKWGLQQRQRGRRFKSARLRAVFNTTRKKAGGRCDPYYDPNVVDLQPNGTYALQPTPVTTTRTRDVEIGFEGGMDFAKGIAKVTYELSTAVVADDQIVINGQDTRDYDSDAEMEVGDPDRSNVAEWNLFENDATRSGLPTYFRTAVLLERRRGDNSKFHATFTINTEVDVLSDALLRFKRFVGLVPRDDPIIFDPSVDERGRLAVSADKLDTIQLMDECKFVIFKSWLSSDEKSFGDKAGKDKNVA